MVVFNCNRCSRGLKKKEVERHSYQCGGPSKISVTCADCLKDFIGNEYEKHTSCVTEEVRYGGKGVVAKETGKKQNQWLGIVTRLLNSENALEPNVRKFLNSIRNYDNIPRNQKKFQNFAKSSVRCMDVKLVDKAFNALYAEFQKTNSSSIKAECNKPTNGNSSSISPNGTEDKIDVDVETVQKKETEEENIGKLSKKERKSKKEAKSAAVVLENEEDLKDDDTSRDDRNEKKKKKKKKSVDNDALLANGDNHDSKNGSELSGELVMPDEESHEGEERRKNGNDAETHVDNFPDEKPTDQLSKKERKLLAKKRKFAAEMMEVEQYKKEDDGRNSEEEKPKKGKKRKIEESASEVQASEGSNGKKRNLGSAGQESNEGDAEPHVESPGEDGDASFKQKKKKFDWFDSIVQVVKSKGGEISVKRLTKKIINEYISLYGDLGIHEKLEAKMKKKLKTCPQVKVLKDKVTLLSE